MTPEGRIKKQIRAMLKEFGADIWYFMPVQRGFGNPVLDYIVCVNGRYLTIEAKRDRHHNMTPQQRQIATATQRAGGKVQVVFDDDSLADARMVIRCLLTLAP